MNAYVLSLVSPSFSPLILDVLCTQWASAVKQPLHYACNIANLFGAECFTNVGLIYSNSTPKLRCELAAR